MLRNDEVTAPWNCNGHSNSDSHTSRQNFEALTMKCTTKTAQSSRLKDNTVRSTVVDMHMRALFSRKRHYSLTRTHLRNSILFTQLSQFHVTSQFFFKSSAARHSPTKATVRGGGRGKYSERINPKIATRGSRAHCIISHPRPSRTRTS